MKRLLLALLLFPTLCYAQGQNFPSAITTGPLGPYFGIGTNSCATVIPLQPTELFVCKTTVLANNTEPLIFADYNAAFDGINTPIGVEGLVINTGNAAPQNCPGASCNPFNGHMIGMVGNAQEGIGNSAG